MQVTRKDIDPLNAEMVINITREDYRQKVDDVLKNYKKTASIPGFRKGHVPMGMIKKQYEKAVIADEVNKLLQQEMDRYIKEEKLDLLGGPLPKNEKATLDWDSETLDFEFELGLAPKIVADLKVLKKVIRYEITPDDKMIEEQLTYLRKQYGKLVSQKKVEKGFEISAQFQNEAGELDVMGVFSLEDLKAKKAVDAIKAAKVGELLTIATKNFFKEESKAVQILRIDNDKFQSLSGDFSVEIKEINERVLAVLDKELFDKLYAPDTVKNEKELKEKIREGLQAQLAPQADQKLMNDISAQLVAQTKFNLPEAFLKRWLQTSGKEPLDEKGAAEEFENSEKGIRYQLIEGKIIDDNELNLNFEELKAFTAEMVRNQMAQYGQVPEDKQLDGIVSNVLTNQEETKRLSDQLMQHKLLEFYKEKAPLKVKKLSYDAFVKEAYGKA
ncbi:MAG: trigger factor [Flavobacteriaceae bacterium]|mgnify:FL=1|nr:trigger factor [Flavobacteriaceae bacterium]